MQDIQGPFYDIRAWLNSSTGGGGGAGGYTPAGSAAMPVLDVGQQGQIRAGHQLAPGDFTAMGLSVPVAIWNLGDLTDVSGNGRALTNKGAVPFGVGINGFSTSAAVFAGSTAQALFIADTGAADPFRIKTGSWGCWFRTAKRGTFGMLVDRYGSAGRQCYCCFVGTSNAFEGGISTDGTNNGPIAGVSDVADDRWHFGVVTYDGTAIRLYVDGVLESVVMSGGPLFSGAAPLNVGARNADGATAATNPHYGRVDEAFVTADVLTDDQIRNLYCAKVAHLLAAVPTRVKLAVTRRRRGAALVVGDFPASPVRLHNFTGGALTDAGTNGTALTNNGGAVAVAGADGSVGNAYSLAAASTHWLSSTDAGLPSGTASRSFGAWFKTAGGGIGTVMCWGATHFSTDARINVNPTVNLCSGTDIATGPFAQDGQWHHVVGVEDNAAGDGVRRKLYFDGRLVAGSTVLNPITLGGAARFRLGVNEAGSEYFNGQIDAAFVYAGALTAEQVWTLWQKAGQALGASPKEPGDHVESMDNSNVLAVFDTLDSNAQVDLGVAA